MITKQEASNGSESYCGLLRATFGGLAIATCLTGCAGFSSGQQRYWDERVKEMCQKDGGVKVFEHVVVSQSQTNLIPKVGNFFAVSPESLAKAEEPAFARIRRSQIREGDPSIVRYEQTIIRRADQRVVGIAVSYARGGGDFLVVDHPSTFWCPEPRLIYEGIHNVYQVEERK